MLGDRLEGKEAPGIARVWCQYA